jgi:chromatin structure-remodeling complex subunit RSC1/2
MASERPGGYSSQADGSMTGNSSHVARSPVSAQHQPPNSYGQQFAASRPSASPAPALLHHGSYGSHTSTHQTPVPLTPQATPHATYNSHYANTSTLPTGTLPHTSQTPNPLATYDSYRASGATAVHRASIPITSSSSANAYNPPRPVEVYHLSDNANASIPPDIRAQFHRDEQDHILFFTAPPLDVPRIPGAAEKLGHSIKYLAAKAREHNASSATQTATPPNATTDEKPDLKRKTPDADSRASEIPRLKSHALEVLSAQIQGGTEEIYKEMYGPGWKGVMQAGEEKLRAVQAEEQAKKEAMARSERERGERKRIRLGRVGVEAAGFVRDEGF